MENKKTFLIINQTAGSAHHGMVYRNYFIAKAWVKQGHKAIIVSSSFFHNFTELPKTKGLFTKEEIDGIEYWWVTMPKYSQSKSLGRVLSIFLFPFLLFFFPLWKLSRPDTIIVSGPPPVSIVNAWLWSKLFRAKLIFEVRDIWPLTIQKLGSVKSSHPFILVLSFFERLAYILSDKVVSVLAFAYVHFESKGMKKLKFAYIPNGIDLSDYKEIPSETGNRIAEISKTKFTVIYAGSFGIANHLDQLLDLADRYKESEEIAFVLIGDGPHRNQLMNKSSGNKNIHFFNYVPKNQIPYILKQADCGFIGFVSTDLYKFGVSPNKIFDYMAAELPILMVLDSEDDIVQKANAGITVKNDNIQDIFLALEKLKNLPEIELKRLGENGRKYLESHHSYSILAQKYVKVAEEA